MNEIKTSENDESDLDDRVVVSLQQILKLRSDQKHRQVCDMFVRFIYFSYTKLILERTQLIDTGLSGKFLYPTLRMDAVSIFFDQVVDSN